METPRNVPRSAMILPACVAVVAVPWVAWQRLSKGTSLSKGTQYQLKVGSHE